MGRIRDGHIWLTGFSGSGKSTVAPLLADRLGLRSYDLDRIIEREFSAPIVDVFRAKGEKAFREAESQIVRELAGRRGPSVIALGGGVLEDHRNRLAVRRSGTLVYLQCAQRELYRRLRHLKDRPLLHGGAGEAVSARMVKDRIAGLLARRRVVYQQAEIIVSTTKRQPEEVAAVVTEKLKKLHA